MAKRKKSKPEPADEGFGPPLNMTHDIEDMYVETSGCMAMSNERPDLGTLTIMTGIGYYTFIIHESTANEMIQALREWMRGESNPLIED
jgi:hypothetical protein